MKWTPTVVFAGLCFCGGVQGQTVLDQFVGRDLWKEPLAPPEQLVLDRTIGKAPKGQVFEPAPWHVWKTSQGDRYVVLLGEFLSTIPGGTSACVQLFDAAAQPIKRWCFQTGWRIDLVDAKIEPFDVGTDVIILSTSPVVNGRNVAKEYFALSQDVLQLVRVETDKGEAAQVEYVYPNYEIELVPEQTTLDEWTRVLRSSRRADVLSALVFLGGRHLVEPGRESLPEPKESKYAALFQQLIGDSQVRELLQHLTSSNDNWIREAALLAVRGPRERRLQ